MAFLYCKICDEPLLEIAGLLSTSEPGFAQKLEEAKDLHVDESPGCSSILER